MHDRALEQVGQRGQADVRMRANIVVRARGDIERAEMVEEHERADRAAVRRGQQAAHHEAAAEVAGGRRESLQLGHEGTSGGRGEPV